MNPAILALLTAAHTATLAGVPLPEGWELQKFDSFGRHGTIRNFAALHASYCEGPNCALGTSRGFGQETFQHFEQVMAFADDHLQIQGRGHPNGTITSGFMIARYAPRSFCIEARYQIPAAIGSWPAFWFWPMSGAVAPFSEIDVEQPITINGALNVATPTFYNHPTMGTITDADSRLSADGTTLHTSTNYAAAPHNYTVCYDDSKATISKWVDGGLVYLATNWRWIGPNPNMIIDLAVGGGWTGNIDPLTYSGDLDVYSVAYYAPPGQ